MKRNILKAFLIGLCVIPSMGSACTDFLITSEDKTSVVGRSMEFGQVLPMQIRIFPKGERFQSMAPNQQKGLAWTNQYAYVGLIFKPAQVVVDGFNEKGLSVGALWMPGTQYPNPSNQSSEAVLFFADVTAWLLGNFASIEESKEGLSRISIYAASIPGFAEIPPIHLSIHDASGKSAAVEFIEGKMKILDNPAGVLTNAPNLSWHLTNLRNYINLSALNVKEVNIDGTVLEPTGQGTGLLGIPGDWTPPSRFVKTAIFKQALKIPKNANETVLAAIHLLNTVDIPYGGIRDSKGTVFDYTQWIVVKDLTNKKLFYRTYGNQNIKGLDLLQHPPAQVIELTDITP